MAGRKRTIPLDDMKQVVRIHADTFVKSVPPISHNVYNCIQKKLIEILNYQMQKPAIQMSIKRYYKYFFDDIKNISVCGENDFNDTDEKESDLEIKFQMDNHEYRNLNPTNHRMLRNYWTDIQCTFSFKSNYVPSNLRLNNIKSDGKCT